MCTQKTNRLFKQKRIRFLGELVDSLFTALPIVSIYSGVSTTIILYELTKQYILNWLPWMNIILFMVILGTCFVPVVLLVYKFVIPSIWHFRSTQMSHLEEKVDAITKKLDRLLKESGENSSNK